MPFRRRKADKTIHLIDLQTPLGIACNDKRHNYSTTDPALVDCRACLVTIAHDSRYDAPPGGTQRADQA